VLSPERLALLQAGWVGLLTRHAVEPAAAYPVFDRLVAAYSEPHRSYHTLDHVNEVLKVAAKLADVSSDPSAIQLATFAVDLLRPLRVPEPTLQHVATMIRATAHGSTGEVDADTAVLLDADLAILSAEARRYARYAAGIRREYAWVEESTYRAGRTNVLQSFLDRPRIFRTEWMHAVAEEPARQNLRAEIERRRLS
jgi:predicted metal-dependent HD superfamily phosphohydrolase